ncbi:DNA mismatch repair ATPase MutS [Anaerosolibacter carboniphilus]|uniref:DNA mismatch repair ATPase MutS n=1 Tax=Anaerosolibacter carboniphilus TaxID=1417629 RepID=A0A841KQ38_9FIRM|nr:DNA mismatch repair protein MutS [Anaerosolibacter carboniphilus]MBB6215586.1 DNA mismatch repair ATPase MutS [Anaerosolibacter carboniphilus]
MLLSERVLKNLEIDYIFNRLTVYTPYGEALKREMRPFMFCDRKSLGEELDRIERVVALIEKDRYTFVEMRSVFKHIKDLRGSFQRAKEEITLSLVELFEIKTFVGMLEKLTHYQEKLKWDWPEFLKVRPILGLKKLLDPQESGINTFYIYDEYSERLKTLRKCMGEVEGEINREKLQSRERVQNQLNVKLRPNGELTINKSNKDLMNELEGCEGLTYSSETYMNITYKVKMDEQVEALMKKLEDYKLQEEEEELRIRQQLTVEIKSYMDEIHHNIHAIGALDLLVGKAYLAIGMDGTKPVLVEKEVIEIIEGRHLKVEDSLAKQGKAFTPITVRLEHGVTCITGANMGGKTISLKLIGLLTAMAQYGLFVPAKEMRFSPKEYIFFSVGDLQSVDMGLSTFGAEILEIKDILQRADESGLILIDELARGTNPAEGYAISKAIIQHLKEKLATAIITTHFDGLADTEGIVHLQVRGLVDVDFNLLREQMGDTGELGIELVHQYMDYRLEVIKDERKIPRDALNIARLMGLQEEILKEAERYLE